MTSFKRLNERQESLLERIASGDSLSEPDDAHLRTTAYALSSRGLITTKKRRGVFNAEVTARGRMYLEQRVQSEHTPCDARSFASRDGNASVASPEATTRRQPPATTARIAAERQAASSALIDRLVTDRKVVIERPNEEQIANWRRMVDFAKRHHMVPDGFRIEKQMTLLKNLEIRLIPGVHSNSTAKDKPGLPDVPVLQTVDELHPVVAALQNAPTTLPVCEECGPRALRILHMLAIATEHLGHAVAPASSDDGVLTIQVYESRYEITFEESYEEAPVGGQPKYDWQRITDYESVPTGRLDLVLLPRISYLPGRRRWGDRRRWSLEDKLPEVLGEIVERGEAVEQKRLEAERAKAERRRRWELAMQQARADHAEAFRAAHLRRQVAHWREVQEINAFCEAVQHIAAHAPNPLQAHSMLEWISWARDYVERIDPLHQDLGMPIVPEPSSSDLKPYLHGWSTEEPDC